MYGSGCRNEACAGIVTAAQEFRAHVLQAGADGREEEAQLEAQEGVRVGAKDRYAVERILVVAGMVESVVDGERRAVVGFPYDTLHFVIVSAAGVGDGSDLFIEVPDEEDAILGILELLRGISVVNIRINEENREDINGILQITFKNHQDLEKSAKIVRENTDYLVSVD